MIFLPLLRPRRLVIAATVLAALLAVPAVASAAGETGTFAAPAPDAIVGNAIAVHALVGTNTASAKVMIAPTGGLDPEVVTACTDDVEIAVDPAGGPSSYRCSIDASALVEGAAYDVFLYVITTSAPALVQTRTVTIDRSAPAYGEVTYLDGIAGAMPLVIGWRAGYDSHPGGPLQIDRWRAPLTFDSCGTFAFDTTVSANVRTAFTDGVFADSTASGGYCYQYRLYDHDLAGNRAEFTSNARVKLPATAPSAPGGVTIDTVPATGAHVTTLPVGTKELRITWSASSGGINGVGGYQWCLMSTTQQTCAAEGRSGFTSELSASTPPPTLEPGVAYVACVRAGDFAHNWSNFGCSAVATVPPTPPVDTTPKPCTTMIGESMQRTAQIGTSFVYRLGDWASCPFPNGERVESIDYTLCINGNVNQCNLVRHLRGAWGSAAGVRTQGIPLVNGKTLGDAAVNPSVQFYSNTKKAHPWRVQVLVRSSSGATRLLHTWTLNFVTAPDKCDQSPLTVIADRTNAAVYAATGSITCTGSGFTYRTRPRSAFSSVVVDAKGSARYTAPAPQFSTDSFTIEAQQGSTTYERYVVVQFQRYAVGTDGNDTMIGSNANSPTAKAARAKRPTARGDVLLGGAGNDTIHGRGGDDLLRGQAGNDRLFPGPGANVTEGGAGNDAIVVVSTRDVVHGGAGNDKITITSKFGPKRITCGAGRDTVIAARKLRLPRDCERLVVRRQRPVIASKRPVSPRSSAPGSGVVKVS